MSFNHESLAPANHINVELSVVILMASVPPPPRTFLEVGLMLRTPPFCLSTNVIGFPGDGRTVMVPVRCAAEVVPVTVY